MTRITSFLLVISVLAISATTSAAQTPEPPRFEVGGQFSLLNFDVFTRFGDTRRNQYGGGGRVTVNINRYIAAEAQVDHFPQHDSVLIGTIDVPLWGSKTLAVFGGKAGVQNSRFGVFGKARPGFIHFSEVPLFGCLVSVNPCPQPKKTVFAFDVGGVVEYYPSRRTVLRFDAGDTIIRHDQRFFSTSHSLQISIGAGIRF